LAASAASAALVTAIATHYNNRPFPWRHVGVFPSDMSLGKGIPTPKCRWGKPRLL
ncbi:hypothetical protein Tco_0443793, partial [Tanacetum coccineum]